MGARGQAAVQRPPSGSRELTQPGEDMAGAEIGQYGHSLAGADAEIDRLAGIMQIRAAEDGEHQAVKDVCALISELGTAELAGPPNAAPPRPGPGAKPRHGRAGAERKPRH